MGYPVHIPPFVPLPPGATRAARQAAYAAYRAALLGSNPWAVERTGQRTSWWRLVLRLFRRRGR